MDSKPSKLITVAQAAELKGLSRSAIYKAIEDGRLKSQRVLGHVALSRTEVARWQPSPTTGWPKGRRVSEEVKTKISEAQKRRWAERRQRDMS